MVSDGTNGFIEFWSGGAADSAFGRSGANQVLLSGAALYLGTTNNPAFYGSNLSYAQVTFLCDGTNAAADTGSECCALENGTCVTTIDSVSNVTRACSFTYAHVYWAGCK
jgi:hypothetical protein